MTPLDEHTLYLTDRRAWAEYVAPRRAEMLKQASETEKSRLWRSFGPESRAAIRALKERTLGEPETSSR